MQINHLGTEVIKTKRLILRRFRVKDLDDMFKNWISDPDVQRGYGEPTYSKLEDAKNILDKWIASYEKSDYYRWTIALKDTDISIGQIAFYSIDSDNLRADIEYCIGKGFWGNGYATEALRAVIDFGFGKIGLNRIQGYHTNKNPESGSVMKKSGMSYEGTLKQNFIDNGSFQDSILYAILKHEWIKD